MLHWNSNLKRVTATRASNLGIAICVGIGSRMGQSRGRASSRSGIIRGRIVQQSWIFDRIPPLAFRDIQMTEDSLADKSPTSPHYHSGPASHNGT